MKRILLRHGFLCLFLLFVTACVSNGTIPWQHSGAPAQDAPRPLIAEAVASDIVWNEPVATETLTDGPAVEVDPRYGAGFEAGQRAQAPFWQQEQMPAEKAAVPTIKVALLVPLSGPHADLGEALLQSAQMALFDMGVEYLELVPRDTKGTPEGARQAAQEAVAAGAQLILGPLFSESVKAASAVVRRSNVNMLAFSTDWSLAGGNVFVMGFLPFSQVERIADYAALQGIERIGILAPNSDYGNIVISAYNSYAYRNGIETAKARRFPPEATDISDIVREFTNYDEREAAKDMREAALETAKKTAQRQQISLSEAIEKELATAMIEDVPLPFDAVLMPVGGDKARTLANLLSYYGLEPDKVRRLGTGLWDEPRLASEPALEGSLFAAPSPDLRTSFEQRYARYYQSTPPRIATLSYDATALAAVLARAGVERSGRPAFGRDSLTNPNGFAGLDGIFRFRSNGLVERGLAVLAFAGGSVRVVDEGPKTFQASSY